MVKIAINGLGRIGRHVFKLILDNHPELDLAAVNDLTDPKVIAHLIKYDSVYGRYGKEIAATDKELIVQSKKGEKRIAVLAIADPATLPWKKLGVDVILECTGKFVKYDDVAKHLIAGAKKVIISAPSKDPDRIPSYLLGINAQDYDPAKNDIMDMGSCTTNCLAPVVKVLNDNFGVIKGFMSTIHAYTNDQRILDFSHKDLRRARAAAINIIPTSTGAAKVINRVIKIQGKLDGIAFRVPVPTVSVVDFFCALGKETTVEEVNAAFELAASKKPLKGILGYEKAPLVSTDFIGESHSSIFDPALTMVNGNLVKVVSWYDNEWGYATRLAEFAEFVAKKL